MSTREDLHRLLVRETRRQVGAGRPMWNIAQRSGIAPRMLRRFLADTTWAMATADAVALALGFVIEVRLVRVEDEGTYDPEKLPRWRVWCPERDEIEADGLEVGALNPEQAATEWAEIVDSMPEIDKIAEGAQVVPTIHVRGPLYHQPIPATWTFRVKGELIPSYDAWEESR